MCVVQAEGFEPPMVSERLRFYGPTQPTVSDLACIYGGDGRIPTCDTPSLRYSRFQNERFQALTHISKPGGSGEESNSQWLSPCSASNGVGLPMPNAT